MEDVRKTTERKGKGGNLGPQKKIDRRTRKREGGNGTC